MKTKCLIFDLDNTIYSVASIGERLFHDLFDLIEKHGAYCGNIDAIKREIMRRPFQDVAKDFHFTEDLTMEGIELLSDLTYEDPIKPYNDYPPTKNLQCRKILVTSGFQKLQRSKIERLGIGNDFEEIIIIDPALSCKTKKDVFTEILTRHRLAAEEIIIIGDDINSEIKAGKELGMETVVYDHEGCLEPSSSDRVIANFAELEKYL
jgi:putative hydrolase of the HAD superfamily